jgi:competence protein ComEA
MHRELFYPDNWYRNCFTSHQVFWVSNCIAIDLNCAPLSDLNGPSTVVPCCLLLRQDFFAMTGMAVNTNLFLLGGIMLRFKSNVWVAVLVSIAVILTGTCGVCAMEKVNINTASVDQLMDLDRVGAKYAERIVQYREQYGPFAAPEDIMKVKGIGQKTWEANKDRIVV